MVLPSRDEPGIRRRKRRKVVAFTPVRADSHFCRSEPSFAWKRRFSRRNSRFVRSALLPACMAMLPISPGKFVDPRPFVLTPPDKAIVLRMRIVSNELPGGVLYSGRIEWKGGKSLRSWA